MKFCKNIDLGNVAVRPQNLLRVGMFALVGLMSINISQSVHGQTAPETVRKIMQTSGFKVEVGMLGGILFLPNEDGSYKLVARFSEAPESEFCEQKQKISKKTGEVIDAIGICIVPNWKAPTGFENDLANSGIAIDDFRKAVNINGDMPVNGTAEENALGTVKAITFNINAELNSQLRKIEYGVWTSCWEPSGTSNSAIAPAKRAECRESKLELGGLRVEMSKAKADKSGEEAREAIQRANEAEARFETGVGGSR